MKLKPKITIADHFSDLEYPRIERTKRHQLIDIIREHLSFAKSIFLL
ncbi:hypothetical protein [Microcoleus sp. N3A4]